MSQYTCIMHEIECQTKACADPINDYLFFGGVEGYLVRQVGLWELGGSRPIIFLVS